MTELADALWLDGTAQAALVRAGEVRSAELVEAAVARCEAVNPSLNAVIHPTFDRALDRVGGVDPASPFAGIPFLTKDLECREDGLAFHEGSRFLKGLGWTSTGDATLVTRFRAAGLVSIGRTNTPEFGMRPVCEPLAYGPTHNPWDLDRSPGGSSGGSAAAVAAGIVPIAHGNDVGGSIRNPASNCSLFGLKPSRGRSPHAPDFGDVMGGLAEDHVLTRSVRDSAAVLDSVTGPVPGDWYGAPPPSRPWVDEVGRDPGSLRIGLWPDPHIGVDPQIGVDPAVADTVQAMAATLEDLGHRVEECFPAALLEEGFTQVALDHYAAGTAWVLDEHWPRVTGHDQIPEDLVEPTTLFLAEMGRALSAPALFGARELAQAWTRRLVSWWVQDGFDLLVLPVLPDPPVVTGSGDDGRLVSLVAPFNVSGLPAASVPGRRVDDLPVGVQFVAGPYREDVIFQVAGQIEQAQPWARRPAPTG